MLSVIRHVIHTLYFFFFGGVMAAGPLLPIYAGVHDLTVMLAILQERMLGVIRHLTHTFNIFSCFFLVRCCQPGAMFLDSATTTPRIVASEKNSQEYMYQIFKLMCAKYQIELAILQKLIYINVKKQ